MKANQWSEQTAVVHAGERRDRVEGAVVLPIFQSSTYVYSGQDRYEDLKYIRCSNTPNHQVLQQKLAALESGDAALVMASGMAAISTALLSVLSSGDHFLAQNCLYGGTLDLLLKDFPAFGIEFDSIDVNEPDSWERLLRPNTKAIYVESISNPLMQIGDLPAVVDFAREYGLVSLIDNTFASPLNLKPLTLGFDLVLHSCTKYLNGHSDIVAGAVVGDRRHIRQIRRRLLHLGGSMDPHACFLLHRGLKTLFLRMEQHNRSASEIADYLVGHPRVDRVNYPGLESADVDVATKKLFKGFGGMLSFELQGGLAAASRFLSKLKIPVEAPSLGGVESLVTRPVTTSHSGLSAQERHAAGVSDSLIRYSVGIEAAEDLIQDLDQALAQS